METTPLHGRFTCIWQVREASSHVAACLFILEINSLHISTSLPCSSLPPSYLAVTYSEAAGDEFITTKMKIKEAIHMIAFTLASTNIEITTHQMKRTYIFLKTRAFILRVFVSNPMYNLGVLTWRSIKCTKCEWVSIKLSTLIFQFLKWITYSCTGVIPVCNCQIT